MRQEARRRGLAVVMASLIPHPAAAEELRGRKVVAFAGIGRPSKFFAMLRAIGADLVAGHGFADHHPLRPGELEALAREARAKDAILVTTEKDMVRIRDGMRGGLAQAPMLKDVGLRELRVQVLIEDGQGLDDLLAGALATSRRANAS